MRRPRKRVPRGTRTALAPRRERGQVRGFGGEILSCPGAVGKSPRAEADSGAATRQSSKRDSRHGSRWQRPRNPKATCWRSIEAGAQRERGTDSGRVLPRPNRLPTIEATRPDHGRVLATPYHRAAPPSGGHGSGKDGAAARNALRRTAVSACLSSLRYPHQPPAIARTWRRGDRAQLSGSRTTS